MTRLDFSLWIHLLVSLLLVNTAPADKPVDVDAQHPTRMRNGLELFRTHVRDIFIEHCLECHSAKRAEGGLNLLTRKALLTGGDSGPAIVPGRPETSRLWRHVSHQTEPHMPLDRPRLPSRSLKAIKEWISSEAPYDRPLPGSNVAGESRQITKADREFWSFRPLYRPALPSIRETDWCRNPVDRFTRARCERAGLSPVAPASRETLIRRLTLDLTGLPPSTEAVEAFLTDHRPGAWARLVDQWLASPHYGERWARHWLDVVRFAESYGFEHDLDNLNAWPYRDFVIRALNRDMPFDQFVQWQIAGDELAPHDPLAWTATGFLAAGVRNADIARVRVEQERYDELDDIVTTIGSSMLGLSIGCARCHDHKYDAITQQDYYRLVATFERTVRGEIDLALEPGSPETKVLVASEGITPLPRIYNPPPAFYETTWFLRRGDARQKSHEVSPGVPVVLTPHGRPSGFPHLDPDRNKGRTLRRSRLAHWLTDTRHGAGAMLARVVVNRLWQHHFGRGIVETPNDFGRRGSRPTHPELLEWLATELVESGWSLKHLHRLMLTSATWRQRTLEKTASQTDLTLFRGRRVRRLEAEAIRDSILSASGTLDTRMYGPGTLFERHSRRSIYYRVKRSQLIPMMTLFDAPDPLQSLGLRAETIVAPQALALMNARHVRVLANAFARSIIVEGNRMRPATRPPLKSKSEISNPEERLPAKSSFRNMAVAAAYRRALGRNPTRRELKQANLFLHVQEQEHESLELPITAPAAREAIVFHLTAGAVQPQNKAGRVSEWRSASANAKDSNTIIFSSITDRLPQLVTKGTPHATAVVRFGPDGTVLRSTHPRLNVGTDDFSLTTLLKLDESAPRDNHILGSDSYAGRAPYSGFFLQYIDGRLKFCTRRIHPGDAQNAEILTDPVIERGRWYRITATRRSGTLRLYLDDESEPIGIRQVTEPIDVSNGAAFKIGDMDESPSGFFNGFIAEMMLFERGLSDDEVATCHAYLRQKHLAKTEQNAFQQSFADFCHALFCLNEFIYIE